MVVQPVSELRLYGMQEVMKSSRMMGKDYCRTGAD